jgi:hypothetical protein
MGTAVHGIGACVLEKTLPAGTIETGTVAISWCILVHKISNVRSIEVEENVAFQVIVRQPAFHPRIALTQASGSP